jgi:hypothetical protein
MRITRLRAQILLQYPNFGLEKWADLTLFSIQNHSPALFDALTETQQSNVVCCPELPSLSVLYTSWLLKFLLLGTSIEGFPSKKSAGRRWTE